MDETGGQAEKRDRLSTQRLQREIDSLRAECAQIAR